MVRGHDLCINRIVSLGVYRNQLVLPNSGLHLPLLLILRTMVLTVRITTSEMILWRL